MKKIIISAFVALFAAVSLVQAQKDVTTFLGIPVDGYKPEMIQKLKAKGFTNSAADKDILVGEFNGAKVNIHIVTNNNKVCRIMVADVNKSNETDIKIRFNNLCRQFQNNKKYISGSLSTSDWTIPEKEIISHELLLHKKRYEAAFFQLPANLDSTALAKEMQDVLLTKYTAELSNVTEEERTDMIKTILSSIFDKFSKKSVWFMISELYGQYSVTMFYDNEYNRANGEDL